MMSYKEYCEQYARWETGVYLHVICGCLFYTDGRGVICEYQLKGAAHES